MNRAMSAIAVLWVVPWCAVRFAASAQSPRLDSDMHSMAVASIEYVYKEDFKQAQAEARKMIRDHPEHPAGYFFMAAVLDAKMEYLQSDDDEVEFYRYCDLAVSKGERMLEKGENVWARFFVGGANGERGTYESRYGRWITAFRHGWQGVTQFRELLEIDTNMIDARFGIATYDYWRSAMTKMLWWMPGVEDKREEAIRALRDVARTGVYVREAAAKHLVAILINEKRYGEALPLAEEMLARFPSCLCFHWGKATAQLALEQLGEAEKSFLYIAQRAQEQGAENHYNEVLCHSYLAKTYLQQKLYPRCIAECDRAEGYILDEDTRKRLEKELSEVALMKKRAQSAIRRER